MKKSYQQGNTQTAVIVILVIALLAALGYIVWQNIQQQKLQPNSEAGQEVGRDKETKTDSGKMINITSPYKNPSLKLKYPTSWTMSQKVGTPDELGKLVTTTITSPSGKIKIKTKVGNIGGLGGSCVDEEVGTYDYVNVTPITANPTYSVFEAFSTKGTGSSSVVQMVIAKTETVKLFKMGDSICSGMYVGIFDQDDSDKNAQMLWTDVRFGSIMQKTANGDSVKPNIPLIDYKHLTDSKEYKDARDILLSLSK